MFFPEGGPNPAITGRTSDAFAERNLRFISLLDDLVTIRWESAVAGVAGEPLVDRSHRLVSLYDLVSIGRKFAVTAVTGSAGETLAERNFRLVSLLYDFVTIGWKFAVARSALETLAKRDFPFVSAPGLRTRSSRDSKADSLEAPFQRSVDVVSFVQAIFVSRP